MSDLQAHPDCTICDGTGLMNGESWGAILIPCVCTGECPAEILKGLLFEAPSNSSLDQSSERN